MDIAQGQSSHYAIGYRKPSISAVKKTEKSMHIFANEIEKPLITKNQRLF